MAHTDHPRLTGPARAERRAARKDRLLTADRQARRARTRRAAVLRALREA